MQSQKTPRVTVVQAGECEGDRTGWSAPPGAGVQDRRAGPSRLQPWTAAVDLEREKHEQP